MSTVNVFGFRRHFLILHLTWALINLAGITSASSIPGQPTNLRVSSVHDLTIMLQWKRPLTTAGTKDNSTLSYIVSYTAVGNRSGQRKTVPTESVQLDLVFEKQYNIFVRAMHRQDHQIKGDWSLKLTVNTNNLVPAKPTNLKITSIRKRMSKYQVTLTWDKPTTTRNKITDSSTVRYQISYKDLKTSVRRQTQRPTGRVSLSRLSAASRYEIKVRAVKASKPRMIGDWSNPIILQTNESEPSSPPTNVQAVSKTPSSIEVSWGPIPKNGKNGVIMGFVVSYCEKSACASNSWSTYDAKLVYFHELRGLETGKQYYVTVAGYTKIGRGKKSPKKAVFVGGSFTTATRKTTTHKSTALAPETTQSTLIKSTKTVTMHVETVGDVTTQSLTTTVAPETTQSTLIKSTKTVTMHVETVGDVTTQSLTTTVIFPTEPKITKPTFPRTVATLQPTVSPDKAGASDPSQPSISALAKIDQANETSKDNMLNKILIIGAPVGGAILLVIIFVTVFALARKRSRKRRQLFQNGGMPKRSGVMVTRGAYSVRYEPPSAASTLGGDSMNEGLLPVEEEPDQPEILVEEPNGTLPSADTEDIPIIASGYSDKCDPLRVDLSLEQNKLDEGSSAGLYDSIGSLSKVGCAPNDRKSEDEERYVTQDQINAAREATREKSQAQASPKEGYYKIPREVAMEDFYKRPKNVSDDKTYVNMNLPPAENLYETLEPNGRGEPVYENTKSSPSGEEHGHTEGGEGLNLL